MKTEIREIPTITKTYVYIASDGKEFDDVGKCRKYEASLYKDTSRLILTSVNTISYYTEEPATLYYIETEEDWNYLYNCIWENNVIGSFSGTDFYIAICLDGGDHPNTYVVYPIKKYIQGIVNDTNDYVAMIMDKINSLHSTSHKI